MRRGKKHLEVAAWNHTLMQTIAGSGPAVPFHGRA